MTTKDIINQMEKEFDEKFHCGQVGCNCADGIGSIVNIKSFIHSYTRTLLESFGEEVVGHDKPIPEHMKDYKFHSIACEISAENRLKAEQRLKVKEIINSIE